MFSADLARPAATDARQVSPIAYEHVVWRYRFALPFMMTLAAFAQIKKSICAVLGYKPRHNCLLGDGMSVNGQRVRDGAARWAALDAIYNFMSGEGSSAIHRAIDTWWMQIRNAQAVRNRLKIAKRELRTAIESIAGPGKTVHILSLAAGSAQGVIEILADCAHAGMNVRALLLDQDESALRHARELARKNGVENRVETKLCNVLFFDRQVADKPDIIEMMGLVDYLKDPLAISLFRKIWRTLKPNGFLLTCHIHPNSESYFLRHVINWSMTYRTPDEFEDLLISGKFLAPRLITEPHGIHSVAVAHKSG
jgi:2-polyprenyl-3-methyl-5-hydroxy-6-metoxy-1,4-benzoquinol methylase